MTAPGNTSHAVRQQRTEARDSLDDFPTPPWAVRALLEYLHNAVTPATTVWEPAANRGAIVRALAGRVAHVRASDVHDYGAGFEVADFLMRYDEPPADWIITNPPFRLAAEFAVRGLQVCGRDGGVALLVRSAFLEGAARYRDLFAPHPPSTILQFCERVVMHKGVLRDPEKLYWDEAAGVWRRPSTATSYCWIVWDRLAMRHGMSGGPLFRWIPPCRKRLTEPGDYTPMIDGSPE